MTDKHEIAGWLIAQIRENGQRRTYQSRTVQLIRQTFGEEWSYTNHNGNWAIDTAVLTEFRRIKNDPHIYWDRSDQSWRVLTPDQLSYMREREELARQSKERRAAEKAKWEAERSA